VLAVAGLKMERPRPESDPLNYLPRVRIPVLMLNGEYDHYFPLETSQKPFLRMLGTPAEQKRHVVFRGGHTVPRALLIAESLQWLDRYLGPTGR
jgi:pimeloyl-ACP methyl ester carboxylesterase